MYGADWKPFIRRHGQCYGSIGILDWQHCGTFHVEEEIPTTVSHIIFQIIQRSYLRFHSNSNHVPWTIIAACIGACIVLILLLRFMLRSENKRRVAERRDDSYDEVYIKEELADGTINKRHVDKVGHLHFAKRQISDSSIFICCTSYSIT